MRAEEIVCLYALVIRMYEIEDDIRQDVRGYPIHIHKVRRHSAQCAARPNQNQEPLAPIPGPNTRCDRPGHLAQAEHIETDAAAVGGDGEQAFSDVFGSAVAHWEGDSVVG